MKKGIFISIKPKYLRRIESGEKNYEFRNYYPRQKIDVLYVYETVPTCELKYIIELGEIIEFPNKILKNGYGNKEFNEGKMSKYAYEIKSVYILKNPISLTELRKLYNFVAPQSYAYDITYKKLTSKINNMETIKLI